MFVGVRIQIKMQSKDIRHMNVGLESQRYPNLKENSTTIRSMDIEHLNADPSLHGHQTR